MSAPGKTRSGSNLMQSIYVCPTTKQPLYEEESGLSTADGIHYEFIRGWNKTTIPDFLNAYEHGDAGRKSLDMYDTNVSVEVYKNFLNWLFQTFNENQSDFR